jgi:hypothetical protein
MLKGFVIQRRVQNEEATLIYFFEKHTCTVTCRTLFSAGDFNIEGPSVGTHYSGRCSIESGMSAESLDRTERLLSKSLSIIETNSTARMGLET